MSVLVCRCVPCLFDDTLPGTCPCTALHLKILETGYSAFTELLTDASCTRCRYLRHRETVLQTVLFASLAFGCCNKHVADEVHFRKP